MNAGSDLHYDRYAIGDASEWMLRIGQPDARPILFLPPLFEELNRSRALIIAIMRRLAQLGHGCWLPDLPATGESERALESCGWQDWRQAAADLARAVHERAGRKPIVAALRGGALLDDGVEAAAYWRFAPAAGASLVRDLERSSLVSPREQQAEVLALAGYTVGKSLIEALRLAEPRPLVGLRTVRLASDPGDADEKLAGPALWRRSEPGMSAELALDLAGDLDQWTRQCAAS